MTKKLVYLYVLSGHKGYEEDLENYGVRTDPLCLMVIHPKDYKKSLSGLLKRHKAQIK